MNMWYIIVCVSMAIIMLSLMYLCNRVGQFELIKRYSKTKGEFKFYLGGALVFAIFGIIGYTLNFFNAGVCVIYFALIWGICDVIYWGLNKAFNVTDDKNYRGIVAIFLSLTALTLGWYLDHNVWRVEYNLVSKKINEPIRIAMVADVHLGTTFNADGFYEHIKKINDENADVLVVVGDFVDDETTKEDMIRACEILGKANAKYGVYLVLGNHDKGYYGVEQRGFTLAELISELNKNNVKVMRDEISLIGDSFYVVGRKDFSEIKELGKTRKTADEFVADIDMGKFVLVLDHQPVDYENLAKSMVDVVLSGHTHGGQLFPFNQVGKWIKANDMIYGHEKRNVTDFIVTSGISNWSLKFKTGTKSEYVVINVNKEN